MAKSSGTSGSVAWMYEDVINREKKIWSKTMHDRGRRNNKLCFGYIKLRCPSDIQLEK